MILIECEMTEKGMKLKNQYDRMEWAGAFGDLGTLIPFAVAYITVVGINPLGLLFMFGVSKILAGFYFKTPVPIQPMKAIGAAAIAGGVTPPLIFAAGITTGVILVYPRYNQCDPMGHEPGKQTSGPGDYARLRSFFCG